MKLWIGNFEVRSPKSEVRGQKRFIEESAIIYGLTAAIFARTSAAKHLLTSDTRLLTSGSEVRGQKRFIEESAIIYGLTAAIFARTFAVKRFLTSDFRLLTSDFRLPNYEEIPS